MYEGKMRKLQDDTTGRKITQRGQFIRLLYNGYWIVDVVQNVLKNIWEKQRQNANWMTPWLQVEPQRQEVPEVQIVQEQPQIQEGADTDSGNETEAFAED